MGLNTRRYARRRPMVGRMDVVWFVAAGSCWVHSSFFMFRLADRVAPRRLPRLMTKTPILTPTHIYTHISQRNRPPRQINPAMMQPTKADSFRGGAGAGGDAGAPVAQACIYMCPSSSVWVETDGAGK